jgi:hypothetical protein
MAGFGLPPASRATVQRCVGQGCVVALTYRYALIGSAKVMRKDSSCNRGWRVDTYLSGKCLIMSVLLFSFTRL